MQDPKQTSVPPRSPAWRAGGAAAVLFAAIAIPVAVSQGGGESLNTATASSTAVVPVRTAFFGSQASSPEVRQFADWVAASRDAAGSHFVIVDKKNAQVYVFDADARLQAATPVLLGAAHGDDSVPGIGERPIALVKPEERTTPAGRFIAEPGHNSLGEDIVWVDYDAAVSMHRVRATVAKERRLERLATPDSGDNRISYGCINVPAAFYDQHIHPAFGNKRGIVYVLPEVKSIAQVFPGAGAAPGREVATALPAHKI